ncbi:hypothetical protein [Neomoorella thermoacetica]|nr:hypothetical protein [Moorella thermoacetica]OIQ12650.1 hypothetical protein MOOTH_00310 [Moorella thermoacetica]
MLAIVNSVVLVGLEGHSVRVEVDLSNGLPVFESVGTDSEIDVKK